MTGAPELASLRNELDVIDRELVELIARRLQTVAAVGAAKARSSARVRDIQREREVLDLIAEIDKIFWETKQG